LIPIRNLSEGIRGLRNDSKEFLIKIFRPEDIIPIKIGDHCKRNSFILEILAKLKDFDLQLSDLIS
jgi:hypothetical protein